MTVSESSFPKKSLPVQSCVVFQVFSKCRIFSNQNVLKKLCLKNLFFPPGSVVVLMMSKLTFMCKICGAPLYEVWEKT